MGKEDILKVLTLLYAFLLSELMESLVRSLNLFLILINVANTMIYDFYE